MAILLERRTGRVAVRPVKQLLLPNQLIAVDSRIRIIAALVVILIGKLFLGAAHRINKYEGAKERDQICQSIHDCLNDWVFIPVKKIAAVVFAPVDECDQVERHPTEDVKEKDIEIAEEWTEFLADTISSLLKFSCNDGCVSRSSIEAKKS